MRKSLLLAAASLSLATVSAQTINKVPAGTTLQSAVTAAPALGGDIPDLAPQKASYVVTFQPTADASRYSSGYVVVYSGATKATLRVNASTGQAKVKLPAATWNAVFIFNKIDSAGRITGLAMVVKKDIVITEATTVEADMDDATNNYVFNCVNHQGQDIKLATYNMVADPDDPASYNQELVEEGNTLYMRTFTHLWHKTLGSLFYLYSDATGEILSSPDPVNDPYHLLDVWMNDPGDDLLPIQVRGVQSASDTYENITIFSDGYAQPATNATDTFYSIPLPQFEQTWWGASRPDQNEHPKWAEITQYIGDNAIPKGVYAGLVKDNLNHLWVSMPNHSQAAAGMVTEIEPDFDDAILSVEDGWTYSAPTDAPLLLLDINGKKAVYPQLEYGYYSMAGVPESKFDYGHPYVPSWDQFQDLVMAKGMPFAHTFFSGYTGDSKDLIVQFYANGQAVINTYYWTSPYSITFNGEKLDTSSYDSILDWIYSDDVTGKGKYDVEMSTVPGQYDGLASQVTFKAGFDQNNDDSTAPAVQIAGFVNAQGQFTNEFDSAADGTFRIVAGDFNYNPETYLFEHAELAPTVEYAPYGTQAWAPLTVQADNSVQAAACYAKAYTASLASITETAEKGWFDMRVSLTDASGNYVTQTVSPAFKIAGLAGISSLRNGDFELHQAAGRVWLTGADSAAIDVYSLSGVKVKSVKGNEVTGLDKGFYIVKAVSGAKTITRSLVIK
jgi:hypothetical protein